MAKHFNRSHAHTDAAHIIADIKQMDAEEVTMVYGIEIAKDGSVTDPTYGLGFDSVAEWANFSIEQDNIEFSETIHSDDQNMFS